MTLVVFGDFQCPHCFTLTSRLDTLKRRYGATKLRIIWKNNPQAMHANARSAAIAGEIVFRLGDSNAFWKFHDLAFANQRELTKKNFEIWARQSGVKRAEFRDGFEARDGAAKVDAEAALAKSLGATGTPTMFVNGIMVAGAQPVDKLILLVDEQVRAAETALGNGTRRDQLYVKLSTQNKGKSSTSR